MSESDEKVDWYDEARRLEARFDELEGGKASLEVVDEMLGIIRHFVRDDEAAHRMEDRLHQFVLRAVAEGAPRSAIIAALALTSRELEFRRWYA